MDNHMNSFSQQLQDIGHVTIAKAGIKTGQREDNMLRQRIGILEATLLDLRAMAEAETEAALSHRAAWAKAAQKIDEALK